ncbi:MAG: AMP-binding protein [Dehalococcoidia bacterium]
MGQDHKFVEKTVGKAKIKVFANRPCTVYGMFHNTVLKYPQRQAVIFGDIRLSYADLSRRVDALALTLKKGYRVRKGDRVALFLKNDDAFPPAFLAVSKIGAISVVLNTRLKKPELEYQLELTRPSAAIVDSEIWDSGLDRFLKHKIEKDDLGEIWDKGGFCAPVSCNEEDVHTILFTSGTTGKPKGVRVVQRNLIRAAMTFPEYVKSMIGNCIENGTKTLIVAPFFHALALQTQFLASIYIGGTSILLKELSLEAFLKVVEKEKVDILAGSPAIYRLLLGSKDIGKYDLSAVKVAGFGAAPMSPDLMLEMKKVFFNAGFLNSFGLTEASSSLVAIGKECLEKPTSVGHPTLGCEVIIVDEHMKEMVKGEIGEIAVRGAHVTDGYYNNPEETRKVFRDGWVLTGDLGRVDEDGFFYIVSRKKDMINRGGENVYPVEVENVICMHPRVFEVAVYGVPDRVMGEKVAASIVPAPGADLTPEEIKQFCSDKLARYKIPEYIVFATALPKNPGGKVIKDQLILELPGQIKPDK